MPWLDAILFAFAPMSLLQASLWLLLVNIAVFALSVGFGELGIRVLQPRRIAAEPDPLEATEIWLAIGCVLLNSLVAIAGWWLWQRGWIRVRSGGGWRIALDVVLMLIVMDFLMYVFHRIAHHPWIFPIVHATHHRYDRPRPLSLFVLNPFEVLGFGGLWLLLLMLYTSTWSGICIYLTLNVVFGTLGHLGVEPFPKSWERWPILRHLGSSTFHAHHHGQAESNFGFYTTIWDQLFRTHRG